MKISYFFYLIISVILVGCNVNVNKEIKEINLLLDENNFAKAEDISLNLIQKGIINEEVYAAYGICLFEDSNFIESKIYFQKSIEMDSTNVKVLYLL
ncbi:MAG: hypothetical protein IPJ22_10340 [Bacteroidetes bacterium]|jgi:tetratricopeptide (TPR) repeat protein|nr:hypothetical protein [Bacteroidota bacterium]